MQNNLSKESLLDNTGTIYFLLLWLLLPILIPFILSHISTPILHSRYIIGSSLAFFLLVAIGISNLYNKKLTVIIPIVILLLSIWPIGMYYGEPQKHEWRSAVSFLEKSADKNDLIYIYPDFDLLTAKYYIDRDDLEYVPLGPDQIGELPERFWVVFGEFSKKEEAAAKQNFLSGYDLKPVKSFSRLNLYKYQRD